MNVRKIQQILFSAFVFFFSSGFILLSVHPPAVEPKHKELLSGEPFIYRIEPEARGGEAYKLIYIVSVPIDVFWRFKTDFHGDFIRANKYVEEQRVIREEQNVVTIENRLTNKPGVKFRWRNILHPNEYRLEFVLENPEECDQKFHYGHFQLEPFGSYTKVSHAAYFDFFGATFWVHYPWEGGMYALLDYIARWEQQTILQLKNDYASKTED